MKYVIFGDIHSNWEALSTFLQVVDNEPDIALICLGDVVGYSASPNECLKALYDRHIPILMGNHERALLRAVERETFNDVARTALEWQKRHIDPIYLKLIANLPYMIQYKSFSVSHANFHQPTRFTYITSEEKALPSLEALQTRIGFFGHTHLPAIFWQDEEGYRNPKMEMLHGARNTITIEEGFRYLVNPGSLGQPRDGDPRASFVVLNDEERTITLHRFSYDCSAEFERIRQAELPKILGERLFVGF